MEKINIAEVLKYYPKGMELDCTTWENVTFEKVVNDEIYIKRNNKTPSFDKIVILNKYGCCTNHQDEKCRIFPKGKTTWEGFVPPCKFKDGDILVHTQNDRFVMSVYHKRITDYIIKTHCVLWDRDEGLSVNKEICCYNDSVRFATEEEKQKLFQTIKENGYEWNVETKTLEKIKPKFKDGDVIFKQNFIAIISYIESNGRIWYHCWYNTKYKECKIKTDCGIGCINDGAEIRFATEEEKEKLFQSIKENGYKWNAETKTLENLIKPTFKVGDRIRSKKNTCHINISNVIITEVSKYGYNGIIADTTNKAYISFKHQDYYELMPNKFDINTLKPFESRVLVRDYNSEKWRVSFWGCLVDNNEDFKHDTVRGNYKQCIPYEGNEHLLGKTDDCNYFYKTWND